MNNQISEIHCHNCGLTIIAKDNANDKLLLKIFEQHLLSMHVEDDIEFNAIKERN